MRSAISVSRWPSFRKPGGCAGGGGAGCAGICGGAGGKEGPKRRGWHSVRLEFKSVGRWRIDEKHRKHTVCVVAVGFGPAAVRPGRAAPGGRRPALHHGVLLQSAVGASAGISAALPEEPLPVA